MCYFVSLIPRLLNISAGKRNILLSSRRLRLQPREDPLNWILTVIENGFLYFYSVLHFNKLLKSIDIFQNDVREFFATVPWNQSLISNGELWGMYYHIILIHINISIMDINIKIIPREIHQLILHVARNLNRVLLFGEFTFTNFTRRIGDFPASLSPVPFSQRRLSLLRPFQLPSSPLSCHFVLS